MKKYILALCAALLPGCATVPKDLRPVDGFDLGRYLGVWHEVARLDHTFERGLTKVTAEYSLRADGGVKVLNKGFDQRKNKWKEVEGRAYFTGEKTTGSLRVSFFRPFYGGYNIIELDKEGYQYALVAGPSKSYLWILARSPELPPATLEMLLAKARGLGFATDKLIFLK
ncbi:MAG TPA: lipocalin family protein [Elusimicrobiales bacterium]|nr:lipocalin family protein [Elusimicrobiales bacterium]